MCPRPVKKTTRPTPPIEIVTDPTQSAKAAGLRYVYDSKPGISRYRRGNNFYYSDSSGATIKDKETLVRIKSLVIPPAWNDVWICQNPDGHLQATGRDARGRKQSRYHPRWREVRDEVKYERMMQFGGALPAIRKQVEHDLALPGLQRKKILATIVRLMEMTFIRVGNMEYARENQSYGLTTMRSRHVTVKGSTVTFNFKGKSGVQHTIDVSDRRMAKIVKTCRDIPGYELFQYLDDDGNRHAVDSTDVNDYLSAITEQHFTAKDFRTWAGTVLTCVMLREFETYESATQAKKNVIQAIKSVAKLLGNTPSVCRKCYVHPAVLESYLSGAMIETIKQLGETKGSVATNALRHDETAMMHLLQQHSAAL
jgi:DNA topoisomerase-1